MSKGKMKAKNASASKKTMTNAQRRKRQNVAKNSTWVFWVTAVALVLVFVGRWVVAIDNGYLGAFVQVDETAQSAVRSMRGLTPTADEREALAPLERAWDLFTSARLRDEVTVSAEDGVQLHGYLYDEGSDVTVVVLPRFYHDGTADFLPGTYLHELTGCNILLTEPRCHGGSGGSWFTYGMREQRDVAAWLAWADETLGEQTFILWGEGTGANTALFAAANGLLPGNVAFIAAESPYASLHELAKANMFKWYSVPVFPFLYTAEGKIARSGAGFSVDDIELADALEGSAADVPVLFLISAEDQYIRPAWSEAVAEAYPGAHEVLTGGGSHGTVYAEETERAQSVIASWWSAYGPDASAS